MTVFIILPWIIIAFSSFFRELCNYQHKIIIYCPYIKVYCLNYFWFYLRSSGKFLIFLWNKFYDQKFCKNINLSTFSDPLNHNYYCYYFYWWYCVLKIKHQSNHKKLNWELLSWEMMWMWWRKEGPGIYCRIL